jgi:hypothetical protein
VRRLWYAWIVLLAVWLWLAMTLLSAQPAESALGSYPLPEAVGMIDAQYTDDYIAVASIEQEDHPASEQVWYFHLNFGKGGRVTLSADDSTPIAKWLAAHDRRKVRVELYEVER